MDSSKKLKVGIIVDDIDQSYLIYDFYKKSLESDCYDIEYLIVQKSNNLEIKNLSKISLKKNEFIFHAGTKEIDNKIFSNGGRVLNFVIRSKNLIEGRNDLINYIKELNWENGFFRKDIGYKILDK